MKHNGNKKIINTSGRPRSEKARVAILKATMNLLEQTAVQDLSIEAIASEFGVSKTTIYRWWPSKASVVIGAFVEHHVVQTPVRRDVSPREALINHMTALVHEYAGLPGRIVAQIIAVGQSDAEVVREFRERFWYSRRSILRELFSEGQRMGEFKRGVDPEFLLDVLYAPIYFRLLWRHMPLDDNFVEELVDNITPLLDSP